jgi:ribonuclease P protein component
LQRHLRLRHRDDFALLRTDGQTIAHRFFVLSYRQNGLTHNRYGFIVVKRLGKAVQRNRIRRLMREAIRIRHSKIGVSDGCGYDIALIARLPIKDASFREISAAIDDVLQRVGLMLPFESNE